MTRSTLNRAAGLASAGVLLLIASSANAGIPGCVCVADLSGNGEVEGADIALVLGSWGTPGPAADLTGDGIVNGADIAIVLGNWGPCEAPANDDCSNAQPISPGTYSFCTNYATTDGPTFTLGSCGPSATQVHNDLWYQFAPQSNGTMTVETCGTADFDTVIAVYSSTIPGLSPCPTGGIGLATFVGCDDDSCPGSSLSSKLTVSVTAGKIYKIRVGSFASTLSGSGALKLTFTHPGESCANTIVANNVPETVVIHGNTSDNAVASIPDDCFAGFPKGGTEWISYTATCQGILTITTCDDDTDFDTVLSVLRYEFDGNCWTSFIECNDDSPQPGCQINGLNRKSWMQIPCSPGEVFRIVVSGFNGANGNYALSINRNCN